MPSKEKPAVTKTKVSLLQVFPNPDSGRNYEIEIKAPEFTSLCPRTGQPDFGTVLITYIPDKTCIELKSLKLYLQQYRNKGIFYEDITNRILDDLVRACSPRTMQLKTQWAPRGGISTHITAEYQKTKKGRKQNGRTSK
jgi:7-cyano-7-deazaguanine reductase